MNNHNLLSTTSNDTNNMSRTSNTFFPNASKLLQNRSNFLNEEIYTLAPGKQGGKCSMV